MTFSILFTRFQRRCEKLEYYPDLCNLITFFYVTLHSDNSFFQAKINFHEMKAYILTLILLVISNVFMTFAWYGHLKLQNMGISKNWPLFAVILFSWGIALLEYCFMVPANRIGYSENGGPFSLFQLKVIQEVITLTVFTVVAMFIFSGEKLHWNHIAAFICLVAAVVFVFLPQKS